MGVCSIHVYYIYMCVYIYILYTPGLSYDHFHFGVSKFETPNCTPPLGQGNERSAGNKPPNRTNIDIVSVSIHPSTSFHHLGLALSINQP